MILLRGQEEVLAKIKLDHSCGGLQRRTAATIASRQLQKAGMEASPNQESLCRCLCHSRGELRAPRRF